MAHTHHDHSHHHHDHNHGHGHSHAPKNFTKAFAVGIVLNIGFVFFEFAYGYLSNSLALIADAGHNLSDVFGLVLAWSAAWLATKKPSSRFTYGFGHSSILAALVNALTLLIVVGAIAWEAKDRIQHPVPSSSATMIAVASVGIFINGITAWLFVSGKKSDLNIRGAYLHMLSDALVSFGVVISGIIIFYTGWNWLDPAVSIGIGAVIVYSTWGLLRDSFALALGAVPNDIEIQKLKQFLSTLSGVSSIHDLHVWAMSTQEIALTVHLVIPSGHPGDVFLAEASSNLEKQFKINHATIQIEIGDSKQSCRLESDEVV